MDRDAILRLAGALDAASQSKEKLREPQYKEMRERIRSYIPDDPDFDSVFPEHVPASYPAQYLMGGQPILAMGAAYLRQLASGPGAARVLASSDLMEQAELLMAEKRVHVAAPIVLAGASLEEILRGLVEGRDLKIQGKPGLTSYGEALRAANVLVANDVKEITSLAGVRNEAAHGDFAELTRERAQLFLDRVNFMLQKLVKVASP